MKPITCKLQRKIGVLLLQSLQQRFGRRHPGAAQPRADHLGHGVQPQHPPARVQRQERRDVALRTIEEVTKNRKNRTAPWRQYELFRNILNIFCQKLRLQS